ncbi:MAG TPA: transcription elongation factor GreA [Patescibacteria group bacterium]|nr:transcription elongation factor GreA [Patescibacteria group bacterium]
MEKYLTPHGEKKIKKDLSNLEESIPEIAERISQAKEKGDLSENAEYTAAKEEHRRVQEEIDRLRNLLNTAKTIEKSEGDKVGIGCQVTVEKNGDQKTYILVGSEESDPSNGRVSYESPLGQALMDKKVGEVATFETPKGEINLSIIDIK